MSYKADRTAEDIKRELTVLITQLKDPRLNTSLLTVVRTEVAHDLSSCKVYISSLEGFAQAKAACKVLSEGAKGYLRRELGAKLDLRKAPELRFIPDDSVEKSIAMFQKLYDAEKKDGTV
ncbi:MAG: 30S ribosome-binding factor RbfA [Clostridia bacterium]|nr:30S ribosome-binding factor RbfA [Clostridia bacterium]